MRKLRSFAAVLAIVAMAGAAAPTFRITGTMYTIRAFHSARMTQATGDTGYVARVAWAAGRGRMDIVSGGEGAMFSAGDYVLFDTAQYLIVHPASKTFSTLPDFSKMSSQLTEMMKVSDVKMTVDTLESAMVNGIRVHHYRTNMVFTMTMDMSSFGVSAAQAPPPVHSTMLSDIWYADSLEATPNPFMKSPDEMPSIPFIAPILDEMKKLRATLPTRRLSVKMSNSVQVDAMGSNNTTMSTAEVSEFRRGDVDVSRMVLPPQYTQAAVSGMEMLGPPAPLAPEVLAKWRAAPK